MTQFFKGLAIFLFILLAPIYIVLLSLKFSLPTADILKKQLSNQKIYQNLIADLNKEIDSSTSSKNEEGEILRLLGPVLKQNLTANYLQGKVEKLIDDTNTWLKNKSSTPPAIAFPEIKVAILKQDPNLLNELVQLEEQAKQAQKSQPEAQSQTSVDISSIIKSDFSIPLGNYIGWIKILYKMYATLLIFEGIFLLILCGLIYWESNPPLKFRPLSFTLLISSITGFILLGVGWLLLKLISSPTQSIYLIFLEKVSSIILKRLLFFEAIVFGALFVISLAGLLAPKFMVQKKVMVRLYSPQVPTSKNLSVNKKQKGLAPIIIILVIAALGGIFLLPRLTKLKVGLPSLSTPQNQQKAIDSEKPQISKDRKFGKTKLNAEGIIDTPVYEDEIVSADNVKGAVVKKKLKSGIDAYFIIPPAEWRVESAEIGEFKELPSSQNHIPLYTDFGLGINVAVVGKIQHQAFIVFDFGNGKILEQFKKLAKNINYCDYSEVYFNPEICASLLNISATQTLNSKYLAVRPKFSISSSDNHHPTYAKYSYYLGADDILVLKITENDFMVPQPNKNDLIYDLIKDSFEGISPGYKEADEIRNWITYLNLKFDDAKLLANVSNQDTIDDLKTYFNNLYLQKLAKESSRDQLKKQVDEDWPKTLNEWAKNASYIEKGYDFKITSINAANLRRAYNTRIKGSSKALTSALKKTRENLSKLRQDLKDTYPVEKDITRLTRAASILTGKTTYSQKAKASNNSQNFLSYLIRSVFAAQSPPQGLPVPCFDCPPPESVLIPFPEDSDQDISEAEAEAGITEAEVKQSLKDLADAIERGDVSLSVVEDVLDILGREEVLDNEELSKIWQDILNNVIKNAMDNAATPSQQQKAYDYCLRYVKKVPPAGLKYFGVQKKTMEVSDCVKPKQVPEPPLEPLTSSAPEPSLEPLRP